jgi:hypothetical protein
LKTLILFRILLTILKQGGIHEIFGKLRANDGSGDNQEGISKCKVWWNLWVTARWRLQCEGIDSICHGSQKRFQNVFASAFGSSASLQAEKIEIKVHFLWVSPRK